MSSIFFSSNLENSSTFQIHEKLCKPLSSALLSAFFGFLDFRFDCLDLVFHALLNFLQIKSAYFFKERRALFQRPLAAFLSLLMVLENISDHAEVFYNLC